MSKSDQIEVLTLELAGEDIEECLKVVTGLFVGLYTAYSEKTGHDSRKEIKIKGGKCQRNITIHSPNHLISK